MAIEFTCPECSEKNTVGPEFAGRRGTCAFCGAQVIVPQTSGMAQSVAPLQAPVKKSSGTPWIVVLAIVCVVLLMCGGVLAGLLLPAVNAAREAGRRASCMNKTKMLCLAIINYESKYGRLPPAVDTKSGQPVSWRVAILPFLDQEGIYRQYNQNEAWNSPGNMQFVKARPSEFVCPSDSEIADGETSYVMITGPNTTGGTPGSKGVAPMQIRNGASNTLLIVEVHGLKIPWTEPKDITLNELTQRLRSGGRIGHVSGFIVGMADGSVHILPYTIDAETLRRLAIVNNGQPVNINNF
jgi:hypothetical protein